MKNHLKRVTSPKSWALPRREHVFIVRPKPSGHPLDQGLPLGVILRDLLGLASTMPEVRKILNNKEVLVDGRRRKDHRFLVGLFDVISLPALHQHYRLVFDEKGHLVLISVSAQEAVTKVCQIIGKSVLPHGRIQYHLHDGRNIISEQRHAVGDSLLLDLPTQCVQKSIPFQAEAQIYLTRGKNAGSIGTLKTVQRNEAKYIDVQGNEVETVKSYLFVVGEKEPAITLRTSSSIGKK